MQILGLHLGLTEFQMRMHSQVWEAPTVCDQYEGKGTALIMLPLPGVNFWLLPAMCWQGKTTITNISIICSSLGNSDAMPNKQGKTPEQWLVINLGWILKPPGSFKKKSDAQAAPSTKQNLWGWVPDISNSASSPGDCSVWSRLSSRWAGLPTVARLSGGGGESNRCCLHSVN